MVCGPQSEAAVEAVHARSVRLGGQRGAAPPSPGVEEYSEVAPALVGVLWHVCLPFPERQALLALQRLHLSWGLHSGVSWRQLLFENQLEAAPEAGWPGGPHVGPAVPDPRAAARLGRPHPPGRKQRPGADRPALLAPGWQLPFSPHDRALRWTAHSPSRSHPSIHRWPRPLPVPPARPAAPHSLFVPLPLVPWPQPGVLRSVQPRNTRGPRSSRSESHGLLRILPGPWARPAALRRLLTSILHPRPHPCPVLRATLVLPSTPGLLLLHPGCRVCPTAPGPAIVPLPGGG
mmetsp:Transcript_71826/g.126531  ORF Transcript_71826/g.126531 Transcript_71826/m.126531 type:complete len:290 (+) Transcript_71826:181-1050(+)